MCLEILGLIGTFFHHRPTMKCQVQSLRQPFNENTSKILSSERRKNPISKGNFQTLMFSPAYILSPGDL